MPPRTFPLLVLLALALLALGWLGFPKAFWKCLDIPILVLAILVGKGKLRSLSSAWKNPKKVGSASAEGLCGVAMDVTDMMAAATIQASMAKSGESTGGKPSSSSSFPRDRLQA